MHYGPTRPRKDLPAPHGEGCTCRMACTVRCMCMAGRFTVLRYFEQIVMAECNSPLLLELCALEALFAEPASRYAQDEALVHNLQKDFKRRGGPAGPV